MIVPTRSTAPLDSRTLLALNNIRVQPPRSSRDIHMINMAMSALALESMASSGTFGAAAGSSWQTTQSAPVGSTAYDFQTGSAAGTPWQTTQTTPAGSNTAYGFQAGSAVDTSRQTAPSVSAGSHTTPHSPAESRAAYSTDRLAAHSSAGATRITAAYSTAAFSGSTGAVIEKPVPPLKNPVQKGQKIALEAQSTLTQIQVKLGWNVKNTQCDVDVSAFLLDQSGRVIGDSWFVFYGQQQSPDGSTVFSEDYGEDREQISVDFSRLDPRVSKLVFVLTINEALEKHLNFSMLKDAYIRILDASGTELVSYRMQEYYSNITSMMIGEIYQHKGAWKFHAIGNGVARDLAGLCEFYGVQVE